MIELETTLRKWGNSFGLMVPISRLKNTSLKDGQKIKVLLIEKDKIDLRKIVGKHKFSKSIEVLMRETDKELYNE